MDWLVATAKKNMDDFKDKTRQDLVKEGKVEIKTEKPLQEITAGQAANPNESKNDSGPKPREEIAHIFNEIKDYNMNQGVIRTNKEEPDIEKLVLKTLIPDIKIDFPLAKLASAVTPDLVYDACNLSP